MLAINLRSAPLALVLFASTAVVACGDDGGDSGTQPTASSTVTATSTASGLPSTSSNPSSSSSAVASGSASPSTSSTGPAPNSCSTTGYSAETEGLTFPGAVQAFSNTDTGGSTACLDIQAAATCVNGVVTTAGDSYENWGAQLGLQLVNTDMQGNLSGPAFDAAALGIVGFRFTLTGAGTSAANKPPKVRLQVAMVNDESFEYQSFAYPLVAEGDDGYEQDYNKDQAAVTVNFADFGAPAWALDKAEADGVTIVPELDVTRLHSVQLQIATDQTNEHAYNVCLSAFEWLDAEGNVVEVTAPVPGDGGVTPPTDGGMDVDGSVETDGSVPDGGVVETDASVGDAGVSADAGDAG